MPSSVVEDIAVAVYAAVYGDAADGYPNPEGEDWWIARAGEVLDAALSSCSVLGLTSDEITALLARIVGSQTKDRIPEYKELLESARSKLLASRKAQETLAA